MPPLVDLVRDSKLETEFRDSSITIHTFIEPSGKGWRTLRKETWELARSLGSGGFGQVQLQRCISDERPDIVRAVKIINKHSGAAKGEPIDLRRELETIAKFSHNRVGQTK
jgi:hypothetical protein